MRPFRDLEWRPPSGSCCLLSCELIELAAVRQVVSRETACDDVSEHVAFRWRERSAGCLVAAEYECDRVLQWCLCAGHAAPGQSSFSGCVTGAPTPAPLIGAGAG